MTQEGRRGRRKGIPNDGTRRLHEEIASLFDEIRQRKKIESPLEARHLDMTYYAEIVKRELSLTYTLPHILRIVNNIRKRK